MSAYKKSTFPRTRGLGILTFLCLLAGVLTRAAMAQTDAKPPAPPPDVVVFQNGDQLTGTMERGTGDSITFKSDVVGEVTIPLAKVKELRSNGSFVVLRKDEKITRIPKPAGSITVSDATITAVIPSQPPQPVPVKEVSYIIDSATYNREVTGNPGIWYGWNGSITG